jgi:hypothetical protein
LLHWLRKVFCSFKGQYRTPSRHSGRQPTPPSRTALLAGGVESPQHGIVHLQLPLVSSSCSYHSGTLPHQGHGCDPWGSPYLQGGDRDECQPLQLVVDRHLPSCKTAIRAMLHHPTPTTPGSCAAPRGGGPPLCPSPPSAVLLSAELVAQGAYLATIDTQLMPGVRRGATDCVAQLEAGYLRALKQLGAIEARRQPPPPPPTLLTSGQVTSDVVGGTCDIVADSRISLPLLKARLTTNF